MHVTTWLETGLMAAAVVQWLVALLNLLLVRLLGWSEHLGLLPLLVRQVFHVHCWFISITLAIFGTLTWRFAGEMSSGSPRIATWLAGAMGLFWGVRTAIQWVYYSPVHWRGNAKRTAIHLALTGVYGGVTLVYTAAAIQSWSV